MKKSLLIFSLVLVSLFSFGQAKLAIGLKGGANFANTDISGSESVTAFHAGAFALVKLTKIGVQPEVIFSQQGASGDVGDLDLTYVNIPVMLKYYLPLGLNLQAGPQFGLLLDAENEGEDAKANFKNSDMAAAIGAGWDAPFGLQLTARYIHGLSDINDSPLGGESVSNRMFQLSVGYTLFKLGK